MTDKHESLQTQLTELNARSRAYTAQLWQVPFAYLGIIGILLTQIPNNSPKIMAAIFLFSGVLGTAVLIHMAAMMDGVKRAVKNIKNAEEALGLEKTAEYSPGWYICPFMIVVLLVAASSFVAVGYFWCQLVK